MNKFIRRVYNNSKPNTNLCGDEMLMILNYLYITYDKANNVLILTTRSIVFSSVFLKVNFHFANVFPIQTIIPFENSVYDLVYSCICFGKFLIGIPP